jgi:DeoR family glycerol-3-phosphate regulon repressor
MITPALNPRQRAVTEWLQHTHTASIIGLATQFQVSDETIRRDLRLLSDQGLIERFHGGVRFIGGETKDPFSGNLKTQAALNTALASAAAQIPHGASLMLDNSSTACFVAQALAGHHDLTIMTPSIAVAQALLNTGAPHRVLLPQGELRTKDGAITGAATLDDIRQLAPDFFLFSVMAIGPEPACLDYDGFDTQFKQAALAHARHAILLLDAAKYRASAPLRVCGLEQVHTLITDAAPPAWAQPALTRAAMVYV